MTDPLELRDELREALALAAREAAAYAEALGDEPVLDPGAEAGRSTRVGPALPERRRRRARGARGAARAGSAGGDPLERAALLPLRHGRRHARRRSAPTGSPRRSTRVAFAWASSPLRLAARGVVHGWLRELFELPRGVRRRARHRRDDGQLHRPGRGPRTGGPSARAPTSTRPGLLGLPAAGDPVAAGYVHPSAVQAIGMLGLGPRERARGSTRDGVGRLDLAALERELASAGGTAIVIANAGRGERRRLRPDRGDRRPRARARRPGCTSTAPSASSRAWPRSRAHLTDGVERADSIAADAHKWLNVPYDCGFAFVREPERLARALNVGAPYLPSPDDPRPNFGFLSPENSRRARALAVWATLRAYGRDGHRAMVERHLRLARHLGERVDAEPELERLAEVHAQHRLLPGAARGGAPRSDLDELNRELGEALLARRPGVRRDHDLRRQGRVPARDRQLADDRGRRRALIDVLLGTAQRGGGPR